MFCTNCGAQINDDAVFCTSCGASINGASSTNKVATEDNEVKYQLKPTFNWPYKILTTGLGSLFVVLFIAFYIFEEYVLVVLPIAVIVALIYAIIKLMFEKKQYSDLTFNFYATKVEYIDGFLNKEEKELKYKFIREVTMSQNIFERIFSIGTIKLFTNASSGVGYGAGKHNGMAGKNGIQIHCVTNTKEQYKKIKEIIDAGTPND